MKRIDIAVLGFKFLIASCNSFDPEDYKSDIEDAFRFALAMDALIEQKSYYSIYSGTDYEIVQDYVFKAKRIHCQRYSYYETLIYLWTYIDEYVSSEKQQERYRRVIESVWVVYNDLKIEFFPFEFHWFNKYSVFEKNSGCYGVITKSGDEVEIAFEMNDDPFYSP